MLSHDLVGPVTESKAEHLRRHSGFHAKCPRCRFYRSGGRWHTVYGTWVAEKPLHLGGYWALGCRICASAGQFTRLAFYDFIPSQVDQLKRHSNQVAHREAVKIARPNILPEPKNHSRRVHCVVVCGTNTTACDLSQNLAEPESHSTRVNGVVAQDGSRTMSDSSDETAKVETIVDSENGPRLSNRRNWKQKQSEHQLSAWITQFS